MNKLPDNKPGEDVNKPSWQEEFDKKFVSKTSDDPYGQWFKIGVLTTEVKAFIQDLLDRKAREIEGLKQKTFCPWKHSADDVDDVIMCEGCQGARKALDQAISILKEK